jgi:hypothetical protein
MQRLLELENNLCDISSEIIFIASNCAERSSYVAEFRFLDIVIPSEILS